MARMETITGAPMVPWAMPTLADWLFSPFQRNADGGWGVNQMPPYPNALSPDFGQTMLPAIWEAYVRGNPGMDYLSNYLFGGGGVENPIFTNWMNEISFQGGFGGYPTRMMQDIASWGGTGGPGHRGLAAAREYGAFNHVPYLPSLAQYGISSEGAGRPLANRAYGLDSPAMQYLAPFLLSASGGGGRSSSYKAPTIQPRGK